ncbi:MAG TPA: DUF6775 family putative metallopeptidase [Candidatus Anoxymicrobiaceae bacterium]|jgi:hypothetical protein
MDHTQEGYLARALFFYATGEPFCDNKDCRLFNAHRQEEMLRAQLHAGYDFCEYHERLAARVSTGG